MIIKEAGVSVSDKYIGIKPEYNTFICETDVYNGLIIEDDFKQMLKFFTENKYNITDVNSKSYQIYCGENIYTLAKQRIANDKNNLYKCTTIENSLRQQMFTKDLVYKTEDGHKFITDIAHEDLQENRTLRLNIKYNDFVDTYKVNTTKVLSTIFKYVALHDFEVSDSICDVLSGVRPEQKVEPYLLELITKFAQTETEHSVRKYENLLTIIGHYKELKRYLFTDYKFTFVPKHED